MMGLGTGEAACGWQGSRPPPRADDIVDVLIGAMAGPGGEAALFERLKSSANLVILDNCEHVIDAAADLAMRLLDAAPGAPDPVHQSGPARHRRRGRLRARAIGALRRRRAVHPPSHGPTDEPRCERGHRQRARPVPLPRRSAAGHRARRRAHQDAVGRGDHPAPRRSVPRAERPDQPETGTPPITQVDHPLELRPAVPRRPARALGTGHLCRRRTPARGGVRPRSSRRAGGRGDRRGRPASESFAGDRRRRKRVAAVGPLPAPRQHPGVRARSHDRGRAGRPRSRSARAVVRGRSGTVHRRCAQRPPGRAPVLRPHRTREHRRRVGLGRHARSAAARSTSSTGSGGPGSSSATAGAPNGS